MSFSSLRSLNRFSSRFFSACKQGNFSNLGKNVFYDAHPSVHLPATFGSGRTFARSIVHLTSNKKTSCRTTRDSHGVIGGNFSQTCSCGCSKHLHTKGDQELADFLTEEIASEKKNVKSPPLSTNVEGFNVKLEDAEVTFTKQFNDEEVSVSVNVNHTVDTDPAAPDAEEGSTEMKSRPSFEVDIKRGNRTVSFTCSFVGEIGGEQPQESEEGYDDIYTIDELTIYDGEWKENFYAVSGEILDGYLYDLLMNLLEERGITNTFVDKMSDFCTTREHNLYINLLEQLQGFSLGK